MADAGVWRTDRQAGADRGAGEQEDARCTSPTTACILAQWPHQCPHQRSLQGSPQAPTVRTAAEVMADQHFRDRGTLGPMRHGALGQPVDGVVSGFPVLFSGGPLPELAGAPTLGMHNVEIYGRLLGLSPEELRRLHEQGVV